MPRPNARRSGAHVLLVEDDPPLREVVSLILTEEGYAAHSAPDGAAALALLAAPDAPPVDAVLLDLQLPGMDGRAFAARYGQLPAPRAPLVVFTAAPVAAAVAATEALGAAGFVTKPFDLDDLLAVLGRCLPAPGPRRGAAGDELARRRREPDARRRHLTQLREEVTRVRATLARVRAAVERLAAAEATRKLTTEEVRRVSALRRESEALHLELRGFHEEFARLREAGRPPGQA
jgi:CheY-like chemotaxis protein